jgi:hypothetical protein
LTRFDDYRFIGARDTMQVYDCDDEAQFESLRERVETEDMVAANLLQVVAPDTEVEARNRGFRPVA